MEALSRNAAKEDSEFEENTPSEITFLKGGVPICLMMLEDWSDIGKIEPYTASYTYSFYCCDANMDMMISQADNFIKRGSMIPTMQQLINLSTWSTELCPTTRVEVQNDRY